MATKNYLKSHFFYSYNVAVYTRFRPRLGLPFIGLSRAHKGGGGGGGGRACNCTAWLWSGRKSRFVPKYTFHSRPQTNYEVFKWVPSTTALTTDRWLANRELHRELFEVLHCQLQCVVGFQLAYAHSDRGELAPPSVVVAGSLRPQIARSVWGVNSAKDGM